MKCNSSFDFHLAGIEYIKHVESEVDVDIKFDRQPTWNIELLSFVPFLKSELMESFNVRLLNQRFPI